MTFPPSSQILIILIKLVAQVLAASFYDCILNLTKVLYMCSPFFVISSSNIRVWKNLHFLSLPGYWLLIPTNLDD